MNKLSVCRCGVESVFVISSPVGDLEVASCLKGVHSLGFTKVSTGTSFEPKYKEQIRIKTSEKPTKPILQCLCWLENYFKSPQCIDRVDVPPICHLMYHPLKGKFTPTIWKTLLEKVKFGETISYGELAVKSGYSAKSSRAVGQAMRTNPVALIIPCHRVIPSCGGIGNYSGGTRNPVKAWLLEHESNARQYEA